jgi:hypothetical protein
MLQISIDLDITGPENSCDIIAENPISTGRSKVVILARYPKISQLFILKAQPQDMGYPEN